MGMSGGKRGLGWGVGGRVRKGGGEWGGVLFRGWIRGEERRRGGGRGKGFFFFRFVDT